MLEELLKYLSNKKILILGYGKEGKSTYKFIRKHFPEIKLYVADKKETIIEENEELSKDNNIEFILGENYLDGLDDYDLIIKAPGVSLKDIDITKFEDKLTSELDLFLRFVNVYTIGITGTKGKSTTSTLTYKILSDQGLNTYLLGNIGEPIFNDIEEFDENTYAVIELSSHALEHVHKSPNIGIFLNLYPEHLDYYKSYEAYGLAKFNIAKFQKETDYFIYNDDNEDMKKTNFDAYKEHDYKVSFEHVPESKNRVYLNGDDIFVNDKRICAKNIDMKLQGMHIVNNIMFVFAVVNILNLDFEKALETIKNFEPLEHRMELVGTFSGITFYNDSIATIPQSTINALKAIKNINTLIIGGNDRGVDQTPVIDYIKSTDVENIICLPKTGEYVYNGLSGTNKNLYMVQTMSEAVEKAYEVTKKDMVCLMSPAATSYGFFKNFEDRGRQYKECIKRFTNN